MRLWIAWAGILFPLLGFACEGADRQSCKERFVELVSYRTEAIETAFGDLFDTLPPGIHIRFVTRKDPDYGRFNGAIAYDPDERVLIFPRRVLGAKLPNPLRSAVYYWPFYQDERYRTEFPVIEAVDNILWTAFAQEAARSRGLTWPHKDCSSADLARRLPCQMVLNGIAEHISELRGPLFNANRLDRIWPEDFARFRQRAWRHDDPDLRDVQHYGGILLVRPLIGEFGLPRTLAYVAAHPFQMVDNNLHLSALGYQARAREALGARNVNTANVNTAPLVAGEVRPPKCDDECLPAYH